MALSVEWLGTVPYGEALDLQKAAVEDRRAGRTPDRLLLLEHPPVVTLGRSAQPGHLLLAPSELARRGIELHTVARGGDVTYHGRGQLVGYPVLDLEARGEPDVHRYLRRLEAVLIRALADLGVACEPREGWTGVFVRAGQPRGDARQCQGDSGYPPRKIASIGVGLRGWVTLHGFALNATLDLREFDAIVPCGLHEVEMTSLARELGREPAAPLFTRCREAVAYAFQEELA